MAEMSNPTGKGSEGHRWKPGQSGNVRGGINGSRTRWMRKILRERDPGGQTNRERVYRHLLEVATAWTIVQLGKEYEVASGRDSVEAAKLVLGYDLGTPQKMERLVPAIAVDPRSSLLDVAMQIYRAKLSAGEMTEPELAEMVRLLLAAEKDKALIFLKALGSKLQTLQSQQIERLLGAYEKDPAAFLGFVAAKVPEPDATEVTPAAPIEVVAPKVAEDAKRAAEAQASVQDSGPETFFKQRMDASKEQIAEQVERATSSYDAEDDEPCG